MKQALVFSSKVWLTTIIVSPIIVGLLQSFLDPDTYSYSDAFVGLIYCVPGGVIFCLPSSLLFWLAVWYVNKKKLKTYQKKIYISVGSVFLALIPFAILNAHTLFSPNYWPSELPWVGSYFGILTASIWFFKLRPINN
jgi:hypothetical protein